mgnify:FL=1
MKEHSEKLCACGCGNEVSASRTWARGHKPNANGIASLAQGQRKGTANGNFLLVEADDELCDRVWGKVTLADKVKALNSIRA